MALCCLAFFVIHAPFLALACTYSMHPSPGSRIHFACARRLVKAAQRQDTEAAASSSSSSSPSRGGGGGGAVGALLGALDAQGDAASEVCAARGKALDAWLRLLTDGDGDASTPRKPFSGCVPSAGELGGGGGPAAAAAAAVAAARSPRRPQKRPARGHKGKGL